MIGLRRPRPVVRAVGTAPVLARCEACRRTGTDLEPRVLDDGAVADVCVAAAPCMRAWAPEDRPRGIR